MARNPMNEWFSLGLDTMALAYESSMVIGLRMVALSAGGAAASREADLMVREKIAAAMELQTKALTGALGPTMPGAGAASVRHLRRKVRANQQRLTRR